MWFVKCGAVGVLPAAARGLLRRIINRKKLEGCCRRAPMLDGIYKAGYSSWWGRHPWGGGTMHWWVLFCRHFPRPGCRNAASVFAPGSEEKIKWVVPRIVLWDAGLLGCLTDILVSM